MEHLNLNVKLNWTQVDYLSIELVVALIKLGPVIQPTSPLNIAQDIF